MKLADYGIQQTDIDALPDGPTKDELSGKGLEQDIDVRTLLVKLCFDPAYINDGGGKPK